MGKIAKIFAITIASTLLIGIALIAAGLSLGGKLNWNVKIGDSGNISHSYMISQGSGEIVEGEEKFDNFDEIETSTSSLKVYVNKGDEYKVKYHTYEENKPEIKVENNILYVKQNTDGKIGIFINNDEDEYVIITVKDENKEYKVDFELTSGDLDVENIAIDGSLNLTSGNVAFKNLTMNNLDVKMTSGEYLIDNVTANDLTISLSSGNVTIKNYKGENVKINETSGDVKLSDVVINDLDFKASSGSFVSSNLETKSFKTDITSGDVKVEKLTAESVDCNGKSGSTKIELVGDVTDYNYDLDKTSGNISYNDIKVDDHIVIDNKATKNVTGKITSGALKITFTK